MSIEEVRGALIEWENLSTEKKNSVEYEARLKELRDQLSNMQGYYKMGKEEGLEEGRKEGIQEGLKEGREEAIQEGIKKGVKEAAQQVARKLIEKGIPISEIAEITGLTEEEIQNI